MFCDERQNNDVRDHDDDQVKMTCHEVCTFCVIVKYTNESFHRLISYLQDNLDQSTKYAWGSTSDCSVPRNHAHPQWGGRTHSYTLISFEALQGKHLAE